MTRVWSNLSRVTALCLCLLLPFTNFDAKAGLVRPVPDSRGAATLAQALQKLPVVASMLHTGAHPDDEGSSLLAYVSRGMHARTAYMALNRGEGGQNLIGPELYDGIGAIRTDELLAARKFDGAEQFFTRAFDYGFSKNADEAFELWGRDLLLDDVVRIIRLFRPDVIVSVFAGSRRDGHGQHQAAGITTREAFRAAADPGQFPEQIAQGLRPWQAGKLYISNIRASFENLDSLFINTGEYSPIYQRSYQEIGLAGRSQHRSQDMGSIQRKGPASTKIKLVERTFEVSEDTRDRSLFDGIDTSFMRFANVSDDVSFNLMIEPTLKLIDLAAREAIEAYRPFEPSTVLPAALRGLRLLRTVRNNTVMSHLDAADKDYLLFLTDLKEQDFVDVVSLALGLSFEVLADDPVVIPGSTFGVNLQLLNRSKIPITPVTTWLETPEAWKIESGDVVEQPLEYNQQTDRPVSVTVADNARTSKPYWRRESKYASTNVVDSKDMIGLPWRPPEVVGHAVFMVDSITIEIAQPAEYRYADQAIGEIRRPLMIAPALSVRLTPENAVVPVSGAEQSRPFQVTVRNNVPGPAVANIRLEVPVGWSVDPTGYPFDFSRENEEITVIFEVTPSRSVIGGTYFFNAVAEWEGKEYREGYKEISYPHIDPHHLYRDAVSEVNVFEVVIAEGLNVGYIVGVGDGIPESLVQLGVEVHFLDTNDLSSGDLQAYDVVISGVRAYAVREDLVAFNHRLLEYVRNGGTYIVQYNQYVFNRTQFGPYPAHISRPHDRVTREEAPVEILEPGHPIFNVPNKISKKDFAGWVQERGLYFWGEWDERYTPLMASWDPGEEPKAGGLLEARYGKGRYIYTGYAWFRQLPAGVPGAYRIFSNLLSLPKNGKTQ